MIAEKKVLPMLLDWGKSRWCVRRGKRFAPYCNDISDDDDDDDLTQLMDASVTEHFMTDRDDLIKPDDGSAAK
jgi:hypothetical protein